MELYFPWPQKVMAVLLIFRLIALTFIVTRQYADARQARKWNAVSLPAFLPWKECAIAAAELLLTCALLYAGGFFSK